MHRLTTQEFLNPVSTQTWANGRHQVRCLKVIQETHDTRSFCFSMQQPVLFFFKPGQFVTLELEIDGDTVMRSYTISSAPSIPYSFTITIKRVPGGRVSNWLHDHLKEGDQIAVHGPVGQFNCIDHHADKVLFLSGGVGITPVMSMARWYFNTNTDVDMVFVHSARTPADIIYRAELDYMSTRIDNFKLHLICERSETSQIWSSYRGFLNREMLHLVAPDLHERTIFCCGPTTYMKAVRALLNAEGFDFSNYHEESFGETPVEDIAAAEEQAAEAQAQAVEITEEDLHWVRFQSSGKAVQVADGTMLFEAAANAQLVIPKGCGMGICGSCRVRVTSGKTEMQHNGGITEEDIAEGYVLSCCTSVKGAVEVEV